MPYTETKEAALFVERNGQAFINHVVDVINTNKTTLDEIVEEVGADTTGLTARVDALETDVGTLQTEVETETTGLLDRVTALEPVAPVGGTIVEAVAATGTLTFTGVTSDGETVTIGDDVYEFDTDSSVTEGNILVDISGGASAAQSVTALAAAITASDTQGVGGVNGDGDTVVLTADTKGAAANALDTTTTCENASFGELTLTGGVDGTAAVAGKIFVDATNLYIAIGACTISDSSNWKKITLEAL